jgi:hypothetical protein
MLQAGFEPTFPAAKRSRPAPQTSRRLGLVSVAAVSLTAMNADISFILLSLFVYSTV